MNNIQKRVIVAGALVIIFMGLVPPWSYTFNYKSVHRTKPAGYALIFAPPPPENKYVAAGVELDIKRLLVQWIVVGVAMSLGFILTNRINGTKAEKAYKHYIEDIKESSGDKVKEYLMSIIRFLGTLLITIAIIFCWSFFGVLIGINDVNKNSYWIYGFGFPVFFLIGLKIGHSIMRKLIPIKDEPIPEHIPERDAEGMQEVIKAWRHKGVGQNKDN